MSRGEVGDTLQYFEASTASKKSNSGSGKKRFDRTQSSNALHPGIGGLNPKALFSVAAMATAPVGTTVIEDDDPPPQEEIVMMKELTTKKSLLDTPEAADLDLCEQCTKKRQARILQQQRKVIVGLFLYTLR